MKDLFTESDALIITNIHLSKRSMPDKQIWRDSSIGVITVKSAYFYARKMLGNEVHLLSQKKPGWRIFWTAKTIIRVKLFIWRLINEVIPTGSILHRKGLDANLCCKVCGQQGDTLRHVFLDCIHSKVVWRLCAYEIITVWGSLWDETEMWDRFLKWLQSKELVETWMYVTWLLWYNRNQCVHRLSCRILAEITRNAFRMKDDFLMVSRPTEDTFQRRPERWFPPFHGRFKLNVDAAFCPRNKVAFLGMVARNESGDFCVCAIMKTDKVDSTLQAELMAIAFGLKMAMEISLPFVCVESDFLMAIQEILKHHDSFCLWKSIISDIFDLSMRFG